MPLRREENFVVYYVLKIAITTVLIVLISEIAKRSSFWGAVLASIPIVSVLAMIWIYTETKDIEKISQFSISVFWLVLPSLALFVTLPLLLKKGVNFYMSLGVSALITLIIYYALISVLDKMGMK